MAAVALAAGPGGPGGCAPRSNASPEPVPPAPAPVVMASFTNTLTTGIASDGQTAFVMMLGQGANIVHVGDADQVVALASGENIRLGGGLAVDDTRVYFVANDPKGSAPTAVRAVGKAGDAPYTLENQQNGWLFVLLEGDWIFTRRAVEDAKAFYSVEPGRNSGDPTTNVVQGVAKGSHASIFTAHLPAPDGSSQNALYVDERRLVAVGTRGPSTDPVVSVWSIAKASGEVTTLAERPGQSQEPRFAAPDARGLVFAVNEPDPAHHSEQTTIFRVNIP